MLGSTLIDSVYTHIIGNFRALDKMRIFIPIIPISSPNPVFDHLLELSHKDDSNKFQTWGFGEEITQVESIESNFTHIIWSPELVYLLMASDPSLCCFLFYKLFFPRKCLNPLNAG